MSFESKSFLARLLAEENLSVQVDSSASTAAFNLKSRTIYIPNWDDISPSLYDLLLGHEVGHARDTPFEGWHDSAASSPAMKTFLNVCEDARIEKRMKRRYPGLRASMRKGYMELLERDLFGIRGKSLSDLLLIDRINLATKLGSLVEIPFLNDVEKAFLAEVEATETWEQVVDVAERLFAYCKQEKKEKKEKQQEQGEDSGDSLELDSEEGEEEESDSYDSDDSDDDSEDSEEESDDELEPYGSMKDEGEDEENEDPVAQTDEAFRKNEASLANTGQEIVNIHFPEDLAAQIVPVNTFMTDIVAWQDNPNVINQMAAMYGDFLAKNRNLIDVYLREFMMRKSAAVWRKARVADTGDICASRLAQYRMTDQIFKSRTVLPEGKNHGMMLLLDMSSSMTDKIGLAVEQTLVLAHFCRKAAIPFRVVGYTANNCNEPLYRKRQAKEGELLGRGVNLTELLHSNLSDSNFKRACSFLLGWARAISYNDRWYQNRYFDLRIPAAYQAGGTPLEDALMAIVQTVPAWKSKNRLDKVNLIVLNDGDTDITHKYKKGENIGYIESNGMDPNKRYNLIIGRKSYRLNKNRDDRIEYINKYLREELNVETYGFFLLGSARRRDMSQIYHFAVDKNGVSFYDQAKEIIKSQRYFESYRSGYTRYFVILMKEEVEVEIEVGNSKGKALVNKISKAFQKNTVNKKLNRIIATKFLELAA